MNKFVFVILHYLTIDDTIACIDSILNNIEYDKYTIVVVDNGSENNTGKLLKNKYSDFPKIRVLLNVKNLGFANGNNIGFRYAKNILNSDFIIMINNDTLIKQKDFINKIIKKYNEYPFHILGPDIISGVSVSHQNPRKETLTDIRIIKKLNRHYQLFLFLNYFGLDITVERIKKKFIPVSNLPTSIDPKLNPENKELKQVKLHGSAIIFSPLFISEYDHAFYPGTFMYCEESILNYIATQNQLKTIYSPEIIIYHKEDSATNALLQKDYLKRRFYYKNFIKSGKVLINLMGKNKFNSHVKM